MLTRSLVEPSVLDYVRAVIYPFSVTQLLIYLFLLGFTSVQIPFLFAFVFCLGIPAAVFSGAVALWDEQHDGLQ